LSVWQAQIAQISGEAVPVWSSFNRDSGRQVSEDACLRVARLPGCKLGAGTTALTGPGGRTGWQVYAANLSVQPELSHQGDENRRQVRWLSVHHYGQVLTANTVISSWMDGTGGFTRVRLGHRSETNRCSGVSPNEDLLRSSAAVVQPFEPIRDNAADIQLIGDKQAVGLQALCDSIYQ
jgi:hypothetical protein